MRHAALLALVVVAVAACGGGDDDLAHLDAALGGETTRDVTGRSSFGLPAPTLTNEERRVFEIGDSFFTQNWVIAPASTDARDGLGPTFNAQACSSCHLRDGRGAPGSTDEGVLGLLLRLSIDGESDTGGPRPHPGYGDQLQDRAIPGVPPEGRVEITYADRPGTYGDGTPYMLREPTYAIVDPAFGPLDDVMISPRLAPQVIGMGLLESIPESDVVANADPDDADDDGISGRPNRVWHAPTGTTELGRFGWKANAASVEAQAADAFAADIGITSSIHPDTACTDVQTACLAAPDGTQDGERELTDGRLGSITFYSRTIAVPARRDADDRDVRRGARRFDDFGCASCHVEEFTTGEADVDALSDQTIFPYTDLLLHDMGPGLADRRPDFDADGSEWRTAPLWGLGLIEDVNGERFLLHDGRARTIEEAILWHGGEGEPAMERFRDADADDRSALLDFLEAL